MSPRPRSSRPTTSFSFASDGTWDWSRSTTWAISSWVEANSDLVPLEELLADHHLLDLRRALADQEQWRVAVDALDLILLRVAVAAVDAKRFLGIRAGGLGGEELRHPRLDVRALARVLHARGLQGEQPGRFEPRSHLGELERDRLVLGDRLAERLALLRVAQGQLERALGDADAASSHVHATQLERVHHLPETLADPIPPAEDVFVARLEAIEDELGGLHALVAHLLDLRRDPKPRDLVRPGLL